MRLPAPTCPLTDAAAGGVRWQLALDELAPTGAELRPRLPRLTAGRPHPTGPDLGPLTAAASALKPIALDGLTASTDATFLARLAEESNLPTGFGARLAQLLT